MISLHICGLDRNTIDSVIDKWKDTLNEVDCTIKSSGLYRPTLCLTWNYCVYPPTDEVCDFIRSQFSDTVDVVSVIDAIRHLRNNETLQFRVSK